MRRFAGWIVIVIGLLASGCSSLVAPNYSPDYSAVDSLKRAQLLKSAVGKAQPDDPDAPVNGIKLRGANLRASDGTFAAYLGRAITTDLRDADLYDPNASRRIDVVLLRNDINIAGFSDGTGEITADLTLSDGGRTLLRKTYTASTRFESNFMGAIAIPKGQTEYPNLVRALLSTIYRDPAFVRAMQTR